MSVIYLHIGSHKTGTTSIQKTLYRHAGQLRDLGYDTVLDESKRIEGPDNLGWAFKNNIGKVEEFVENGAYINESFYRALERYDSRCESLVLSSEEFSFVFSKSRLVELREGLREKFDEIKIVVYLRRQDKHLASHHQQACRAPGGASEIYGNSPVAMPIYKDKFDVYLDYNKRIGLWGDVFGDKNIALRIFEPTRLIGGDVVTDFFDSIEIDLNIDPVWDNESLSKVLEKVKHLAINAGFSRNESLMLNKVLGNNGPKMAPSDDQCRQLMERFCHSNESLRKRFSIKKEDFFDDVFNYGDVDNSAWVEGEVNDVITKMLISMRPYLKNLN